MSSLNLAAVNDISGTRPDFWVWPACYLIGQKEERSLGKWKWIELALEMTV